MNIYIGEPVEVSDMQGPCPDGFHVPLSSEWQAIYDAGISLGAWNSSSFDRGTKFSTYLKMPYTGYRNYNKTIDSVGTNGMYYSSSSDYNRLFIRDDSIVPKDTLPKAFGASIRAFRDSPVAPDSTWTELYTNGIYHNSTLGLISVKNGSSWITIADKNLGATTVYNYGDTLTDANCGNVFQWGNNYAFPGTKSSDSITSSATRVDASSYGPGNYYNSSTWIAYNGDWSNPSNNNLRGGVSQGSGTKSTELKNAYIGEVYSGPLRFTANTAGSTIKLNKNGTPTVVTLETSTDGSNWSTYTFGDTITLSNIGDKVYFRNTNTTDTGFTTGGSYYRFAMTGSISGGGDITTLINKNGTTTVSDYCFYTLFQGCTALTTAPELPATTLGSDCYSSMFYGCTALTTAPTLPATTLVQYCYSYMFNGCTSLNTLPNLPATTLPKVCYQSMFNGCTNIKLSTTQTGAYQTPYRIPTTGTGTLVNANALYDVFTSTGGTFTGTPTINTTYYTSNTVV